MRYFIKLTFKYSYPITVFNFCAYILPPNPCYYSCCYKDIIVIFGAGVFHVLRITQNILIGKFYNKAKVLNWSIVLSLL